MHIQLIIINKGPKNIQWERTVSSINGVKENCTATCEMTIISYHTQELTQKEWVKDLNIRPETIKFLRREHKLYPIDIGLGDHFFNLMLKAKAIKKNK